MKESTWRGQRAFEGAFASVVQFFLYGVFGVLMSNAVIFKDFSPFGFAFVAAVPSGALAPATFGAVLGYMLPGAVSSSLRYVATVVAVAGVKWALGSLGNLTKHAAFAPCTAFFCYILTGVAASAYMQATPIFMVMTAAHAFLAAGAAYFFKSTIDIIGTKRGVGALTEQELTGAVITLGVVFMSLSAFTLYGISPGRVLAMLFILAAARFGHEAAGAVVGISFGLMMSLSNSEMGHLPAAYAFGGLLSGVFSPLGRIGCSAAFVIANGIVAVREGGGAAVIASLYEVMAASVLFLVVPAKVCDFFARFFDKTTLALSREGLRNTLITKLKFASRALSEVSEAVEVVSEKLAKICARDINGVYTRAAEEVCRRCALKMYCWETAFSETMGALNDATLVLKNAGHLTAESIPAHFTARCRKLPEFIGAVNKNYENFVAREGAERRVAEVRSIVAAQFEGISGMLTELSEEIGACDRFDLTSTERVIDVLKGMSVVPGDVSCRIDRYERMTVEIMLPEGESINRAKLTRELSLACGRSFDFPCVKQVKGQCQVILTEKAGLTVKVGCAQHAYNNGRICGDAYEYFFDGKGRVVMIISDGMGTGGRAAVDGAMAAGLISKLLKAGFSFDCALKIVNSALLCKSGDESLATLDIASIDLFTGQADFFKAGASASVIRREGTAYLVESASLPAGILKDVSFEHSSHTLSEGDIVLLMSDGAVSCGTDWIEAEIEAWREGTAQELAEHLVKQARRRRMDGHDDDITVMAAVIGKGI